MQLSNFTIVILILILIAIVVYKIIESVSTQDHFILNRIRTSFIKINPRFGNIPLYEGNHGAYTENKQSITICLKNPKTGEYYSMNQLMYVALHELAHIINKEYGHGPEFKANFNRLLVEAVQKGVYDPTIPLEQSYCGVE